MDRRTFLARTTALTTSLGALDWSRLNRPENQAAISLAIERAFVRHELHAFERVLLPAFVSRGIIPRPG
jgi:hypothetical protein